MQRYKIYLIYTSRHDFLSTHLLIARKQHIFRRLALKKCRNRQNLHRGSAKSLQNLGKV